MRAYPSSREWLALLIRRMDAVASVYRLASSLSTGIDGLRSHVESRDVLESRGLRLWCHPSWVFGSSYHSLSCLAFHKCYSVRVAFGDPAGGLVKLPSAQGRPPAPPADTLQVRRASAGGVLGPSPRSSMML